MKILIDTREQIPLEFSHPYISGIDRTTLTIGDYHCEFTDGYKPPVIFERKSLPDLYSTLSSGYKRFKKECNKAIQNNITLIIIIEASLTRISNGCERSERKPEEIIKQLFTLYIKHGIPFVCCNSRNESSLYITNFYIAVGNKYIKDKRIVLINR